MANIPGSIADADFKPDAAPQMQAQGPADGSIADSDFVSDEDQYGGLGQQAIAGLEGAAKGAAGFLAPAAEQAMGVSPEAMAGREAANPWTHGVAEAAGLIGPAVLTGGASAEAKAALEVGTLSGWMGKAGELAQGISGLDKITKDSSYLAKVGASAVQQAAEMAVFKGSDEAAKMILSDPDTSSETAFADIGAAAMLGGGTGAFFTGAVSPLWKATIGKGLDAALRGIGTDVATKTAEGAQNNMRPLVKGALSTLGGVPKEIVDSYLDNHAAIQALPDYQEGVYGPLLEHVGKLSDDVAEGKLSVSAAKAEYKTLEHNLMSDLRNRGVEAGLANSLAKQSLKDAQTKLAYDLQQQALGAGRQVAESVELLRNNVIDQSSKAYDVLANSDKTVPISGLLDNVEMLARDLEGEGTIEARSQAARLREYGAGIEKQFGSKEAEISGVRAKELIQGLDKVSKYDYNATAFDKGLSRSYKMIRHNLDDSLKKIVPEYAKEMKPLAQDVELLKGLSPYGTEEDAISRLKSIKNPDRYKTEFPMLQQLEKRTGMKFTHDIEPYANAELRGKLSKALPEYEDAQKIASELQILKDPRTRQALQDSLQRSEEAKAVSEAEAKLAGAEAEKEKIKGVTPQTLQGKLNSVSTPGKNIANEAILSKLPKIDGKTVPEIMNLLRVKEAFDKNATRGSKHVNLYASIMGALSGLLAGGEGAMGGVGLGAGIGAIVDNFGPQGVKKILDKYVAHFGDLAKLSGENAGIVKTMIGQILGHDGPHSAEGFKAGVDYISAVKRGDKMLDKAVANVFRPGVTVLTTRQLPQMKDIEKLDKLVAQNQQDPSALMKKQNIALGHYMPNQQMAMSKASAQTMNYLVQNKPKPFKPGPLDKEIQPSKEQEEKFHKTLEIAQQPAIVLQKAKDGTIQSHDVFDLQNMFPKYYENMCKKLTQEVINNEAENDNISYKTRIGLSMLLQQPMDSTMTPQAIMSAQPKPKPQPQQGQQGQSKSAKRGTASLGKSNKNYMTPSQGAEADKGNRD